MNGIIRIEIGNPNIPPTAVNGNTAPNSAAGTYLGTSQSPMKALMKSPIRCITNRTRAYHQSSPNWSLIFLKNFTATAYHNHREKAIQNDLERLVILVPSGDAQSRNEHSFSAKQSLLSSPRIVALKGEDGCSQLPRWMQPYVDSWSQHISTPAVNKP